MRSAVENQIKNSDLELFDRSVSGWSELPQQDFDIDDWDYLIYNQHNQQNAKSTGSQPAAGAASQAMAGNSPLSRPQPRCPVQAGLAINRRKREERP